MSQTHVLHNCLRRLYRARMDILISGASIAGPALAYWLNHYGFRVTVVERAPALREGGYKVDIRGVAITVAERMGILDDIRAASTNMGKALWVNRGNKTIATFPADFFEGRAANDDELMRGDLARILFERTRGDVEYQFDNAITAMDELADGVMVSFERGPARRFDLVVGADGLHSGVRALAFGPESQFTRHLGAYISIYAVPNYLDLDHTELFYGEPDKVVNMYSANKNTEARALFIFNSPPLEYGRDETKQLLAQRFAGSSWHVPRLLSYLDGADDFYFDAISLIEMDRWSTGRVVLLGDAAYCASPASGQGTALALVGAYVLAGELAEAGGDYTEAFAEYERQMRPYIQSNQDMGVMAVKQFTVKTWTQQRVRNVLTWLMARMPGKEKIAVKMTREIQNASNAIALKSYSHGLPLGR